MLEEDKVAVAVFMGGIQGKQRGKKVQKRRICSTSGQRSPNNNRPLPKQTKKKSATCVYTSLTMLSGDNAN